MFCGSCGKKIADDAGFCGYCGAKVHGFEIPKPAAAPVPAAPSAPETAPKETAPAAPPACRATKGLRGGVIVALILGTCSLAMAAFDAEIGLICGVVAVVFGALNLKHGKPNRPFCIAGFAAGIAGVILGIVLLLTSGRVTVRLFTDAPTPTPPPSVLTEEEAPI